MDGLRLNARLCKVPDAYLYVADISLSVLILSPRILNKASTKLERAKKINRPDTSVLAGAFRFATQRLCGADGRGSYPSAKSATLSDPGPATHTDTYIRALSRQCGSLLPRFDATLLHAQCRRAQRQYTRKPQTSPAEWYHDASRRPIRVSHRREGAEGSFCGRFIICGGLALSPTTRL